MRPGTAASRSSPSQSLPHRTHSATRRSSAPSLPPAAPSSQRCGTAATTFHSQPALVVEAASGGPRPSLRGRPRTLSRTSPSGDVTSVCKGISAHSRTEAAQHGWNLRGKSGAPSWEAPVARESSYSRSPTAVQNFGRPRQVDHKSRSSRPAWPTRCNPIFAKNIKISQQSSRLSLPSSWDYSGTTGTCRHTWLIFSHFLETRSCFVGQAGLQLLGSSDPLPRPPKVLRLQATDVEEPKISLFRPGTVAHACNTSSLGGRGERIVGAQEFESSLDNIARP
ncbi:EEF1A lysine methyltransferase 2 [Plecturocebus cupreus]